MAKIVIVNIEARLATQLCYDEIIENFLVTKAHRKNLN